MTGGEVLAGRYRLVRPLGTGGSGRVHEAQDTTLGRRVAVKILAPTGPGPAAMDSVALERFQREANALARISSGTVVRVLDAGVDAGTPFLVMELLDGVELQTLVDQQGPLPVNVAEAVAAGICAGLAVVHEAGVVHRDVKPSNVMITRSGRVVLQDFGLARAVDNDPVTALGAVVGTPLYMAPETIRGASPRPASDLYGLGLCMYTMLTGQRPFAGESELGRIILQIVDFGLPRLTGTPGIPPGLAELVDALTARDAAARPQSAVEVFRALPSTTSEATSELLRDIVARCVRDQAVATVSRVEETEASGQEYPEYFEELSLDEEPGPDLRLRTSVEIAIKPVPLGLSDATRQMVISGMTAGNATSRLREAVTLVQRGDLQEAVRILGTVVQVCSTSLGRDHPTTLAGQYWQAVCLSRLGAGGEAVALFSAVSERCEAQRPDRPDGPGRSEGDMTGG